jgi:hypothetical protein
MMKPDLHSSDSIADDHSGGCATARPDWLFRTLVTALFAVALWLLAMPWVPAIARCTMQRFHLKTSSFGAWAIQQPIPPMYSFANTTEVRSRPPVTAADRSTDPTVESENDGVLASRTINHFPTREFTFASSRVRYLRDRSSKWFVLRSTYRGQTIESLYRLDPEERGWSVKRMTDNVSVKKGG